MSHPKNSNDQRSLLQKIAEYLHPGPDSREELMSVLLSAENRGLIGVESRGMLEGVIRMSDGSAGDVMVASPRMDMIEISDAFEEMLHQVIDIGHSRYPVYENTTDNIIGILHSKDLIKLQRAPELNIRTLLRAVVFVPESKNLIDLLREFRRNRNHMAIVIDEFGRIAGLVTIEDVLEEIVGEIEDEFDTDPESGDIFGLADRTYRVAGHTPLERVNEAFGVNLVSVDGEDAFDTVGGLIAHEMGHVPKRGEHYTLAGLRFDVMHSRGGSVKWFRVKQLFPK
ncbi:MAG: CBS domain-containing protein [Betaproteobacteria bacterium]|jgi:magnesium and cobalt transporter|nr:CBS domain-containing protein [Betaproteobacteria bacterium]NBT68656.1 CBS domain-containing protein [Betaproteobacteria bacterium]NBY08391.1 CBS domain-containing protein [Betaproteobacteria bacterium]